jgi:hypothetical protein
MLGLLIVGCCAYIFYRIGEMEYGHGTLLCVISLIVSSASPYLIPIPIPFVTTVVGQLILFFILWVYNFFRKKPVD